MNGPDVEECLTLLAAGYAMVNRQRTWREHPLLQQMYRDLLTRFQGDTQEAFEGIKQFCTAEAKPPDTAELAVMLRRLTPVEAERRPDMEPTPPGTAYRCMLEGFVRRWNQRHPGESIPEEWEATFKAIAGRHGGTLEPVEIPIGKPHRCPTENPLPPANHPAVQSLVRSGCLLDNARRIARWQIAADPFEDGEEAAA